MIRSTYTLAELQLSPAAYTEIANKLLAAGYDHVFIENGMIDMSQLGITRGSPIPHSDILIDRIIGYGGRCRECADNDGTCEGSGLPCDVPDARRAIRHVLDAKSYYDQHPEFLK